MEVIRASYANTSSAPSLPLHSWIFSVSFVALLLSNFFNSPKRFVAKYKHLSLTYRPKSVKNQNFVLT